MTRADFEFTSGGSSCRGWHFAPEVEPLRAAIVMAHGFGGTIDAGLEPFAERFAAAGFDVLVFDYRHFGGSDGEPRQLLSVKLQLEDWAAAIDYADGLAGVDRVGLWGTSFSGGHVIVAGARDPRVVAVTSQCPMMDGLRALATSLRQGGVMNSLAVSRRALADLVNQRRGLPPVMLAIVGPPGSLAAMTTPDAEPGFMAIAPPGFINQVAARIALEVPTYRPYRHAARLSCPLLVQICDDDSVAPAAAAVKVVELAPRAELVRYPVGHFDVYVGDGFERSVADQVEFFTRHLSP